MAEPPDAMEIDGRTILFIDLADGGCRVESEGRLIGHLDRLETGAFHVRDPGGEFLTHPSPWGGDLRARFATRELAARALLAAEATQNE